MASFGEIVMAQFARMVKQVNITGKLWEDARFILADVPLKPAEAKKLLPFGMKLAEPAAATLFISDYRNPGFTVPYKEAAVLIHVKTIFGPGLHCCWMVVDDDTALIYGRELLGYPKKLATIEFDETDTTIKASVTRRGTQVLTLTGTKGNAQSHHAPVFDIKTFNAGGMGQMFACNPVWLLRPVEEIRESYDAEVTVDLQDSEFDPIAAFLEAEPVKGRMAVTDILGSKYMIPVGIAGMRWLSRTFSMRMR